MEDQLVNQLKIARNIKLLRQGKGLTQEQIADALSIPSSRYANYEQGTRSIPIDILIAVSGFFRITLDALAKSDLSKVDLNGFMNVGENRLLFPILISENDKFQGIEVVTVKASAGYLKGYADPEFIGALPIINVPFVTKSSGSYRGFPIVGDSMLPIPDDSIVIGKFVESLSDIKDGNTYIVVSEDGIVYKRVYNKVKDDKTLLLVSDNKVYPPYKIKAESIYEVWEYKGFFSTKIYRDDEYSLENLYSLVSGISKEIREVRKDIKDLQ